MREFQHHVAVGALVGRLEQTAVAPVGQHVRERKIVDGVAAVGQIENRQRRNRVRKIVAIRRRQVDDVEHQRGRIVAAAGREPGLDDSACRLVGRRAFFQQLPEAGIAQRAVNAVAADQETVMLPQPTEV